MYLHFTDAAVEAGSKLQFGSLHDCPMYYSFRRHIWHHSRLVSETDNEKKQSIKPGYLGLWLKGL